MQKGLTMKVYGTPLCIDCRKFKAIQEKRGLDIEYIDITSNSLLLRDFILMRDTDPAFDKIKANSGVGIPFFVNEDGRKTFDFDEALSWIGQPPVQDDEIITEGQACSVHGC